MNLSIWTCISTAAANGKERDCKLPVESMTWLMDDFTGSLNIFCKQAHCVLRFHWTMAQLAFNSTATQKTRLHAISIDTNPKTIPVYLDVNPVPLPPSIDLPPIQLHRLSLHQTPKLTPRAGETKTPPIVSTYSTPLPRHISFSPRPLPLISTPSPPSTIVKQLLSNRTPAP